MRGLYPDLARRDELPPSLVERQAHEWIAAEPLLWRPDLREPSDCLAVYGAIAFTAAIGRPCGFDGVAVRGPNDLERLIFRTALVTPASGDARLIHEERSVMTLRHGTSKLWAGQATLRRIWDSCMDALTTMSAADLDEDRGPVALDWVSMQPFTATGYDERVVKRPIDIGFDPALHGMRLAGGRPIVELYALIGASIVEAAGRWVRPSEPRIPRLEGIVLRDNLDAQRWLMIGEPMVCSHHIAGKGRGYLTAQTADI